MKLKKFKKAMLTLLLIIMGCFLCACNKQSEKEQQKAVDDSQLPELKIGVNMLKPYFYMNENGDYIGIDAEIAKKACNMAGYRPSFVEVPWGERDEFLNSGKVDCLWTALAKDGREEQYLWTDTYMESKLKILVGSKSPDKALESYKGTGGIAVQVDSKSEELLLNSLYPGVKVYSCSTFMLAQTAFVKGYADGLACNEEVLQDVLTEYPGMYHYLDYTLMTVHLAVAFEKSHSDIICRKINEALKTLKENRTVSSVIEKYNVLFAGIEGEAASDEQK